MLQFQFELHLSITHLHFLKRKPKTSASAVRTSTLPSSRLPEHHDTTPRISNIKLLRVSKLLTRPDFSRDEAPSGPHARIRAFPSGVHSFGKGLHFLVASSQKIPDHVPRLLSSRPIPPELFPNLPGLPGPRCRQTFRNRALRVLGMDRQRALVANYEKLAILKVRDGRADTSFCNCSCPLLTLGGSG